MRVSIRSFLGLVGLGVLMPGIFLLIWSTGKIRKGKASFRDMDVSTEHELPRTARDRWYEPHEDSHTDVFKAHKTIHLKPKETLGGVLFNEPPRLYGQTNNPLQREAQKSIQGPPRPWVYKNPDGSHVNTYKLKLKPKNFNERDRIELLKVGYEDPRNKNGDIQKSWRNVASATHDTRIKWWRQHMRNACHNLGMAPSPDSFTPEMMEYLIVDDTNKLLFCHIAKVASTTWKRVFLQLTGKVNVSNFLTISANDIHHRYDQHFTYLSEFSKEQISQRLRDYFKFVFVREPLERILSAYKNKFFTKTLSADYFKWKFGRKIIARYRRPLSRIPANNTGEGVTFEEFASYLVDDKQRIKMNEHWEEYNKMCHPCLIDYDFVGHLERIDEDSQYVLDLNALSDRIKVPSRRESLYSYRKTNSYMKEYYSQLKPETISRLYQKYKADYLIFNYTIPADVLTLMNNKPSVSAPNKY